MNLKYDITFHPSWWHKYAGVDFTQEFFDDPEYRMEADLKMKKALYEHLGEFGLGEKDPVKRPLLGTDFLAAGYLYSELMGCEIKYEEDNSPQVVCMNLDEDEIEQIQKPDLDKSPVWQRTQKQIDYLLEKYGRVESHVNLMGIQNIAMDIMGQDVMVAYYSAPDEVRELMQKITDMSIEIGKRFYRLSKDISGGVTAIVQQVAPGNYLTSNCSVEMVSNQIYEEFLLDYDTQLAKAFPNFGIHHCGKTMEHVVEGYRKVPNLKFAEVGAFSDIRRVREVLPDVFLNARYSPVRLGKAGEDEVMTEVRDLIAGGMNPAGQVSISCVGLDSNVPDEQIRYFLKACQTVAKEVADK